MVPDVYVLFCSWGHRCAHSTAHLSNRFEPLSDIILLCQGIQLCYGVYDETKQYFGTPIYCWFQCFWAIFSSLNVKNFWFYIWVVVAWVSILRHKWPQVTSYTIMPMNKKPACKDHQINSKMLRKICKK